MTKLAKSLLCCVALLASAGTAGYAADLAGGPQIEYCQVAGASELLLTQGVPELRAEVVQLMDESVAVSEDPHWIFSARPAFVWAVEAKAACGKAIGYLKASYRDEDTLNKCACFHSRMVEYMN
ncbi:hypothetical protein M2281_002181 [Mesorhizobium soli]|uniref:hypothetical protein n=1 Tax=Pseudaminobacter soli (ex Li et al. 2025) TaxID=1295366 RepID=UPI0024756F8C|nr:hypothetical protein [Mesorhizobium soli]MDH6231583.1 hypothetical protein [Mesorhizobium soli]